VGHEDVRQHGDYVPEHQVGPDTFFAPSLIEIGHHEGGDGWPGNRLSKCSGSGVHRNFLGMSGPPCWEPECFLGVVKCDSDWKKPLPRLKRHGDEPKVLLGEECILNLGEFHACSAGVVIDWRRS